MLHRVCTRSVIVTLFLSLFTFNALAAENATVFEERLYARERGAPVTETEHFRINAPQGDYTLTLSNGGHFQGQSYDPITSATVRVNGATVAGPNAFNRNVSHLERTFPLTANDNQIDVTLRGKPGSGFTVTITGFENHEPLIRSLPTTEWTDNLAYRYPLVAEDPDNDPLSYSLSEALAGMTINTETGLITWAEPAIGTYDVTASVSDGVGGIAHQSYALTVTDGAPPVVTPPADLVVEATATHTLVDLGNANAQDQHDGPLTATANPTGPFALGDHTITWSATDSAGNTGTAIQTLTVRDTTPPSLTLPDNIITVSNEPIAVDLGQATTSDLFGPVMLTNDAPALFPVGETQVTWTATDANGNTTTDAQWVIVEQTDPVGDLPPDPADVAPPLENGSASLKGQTSFLYSGPNPIQTGVAENTITESRAAVIRGRVLDRDDQPLSGVKITIKGHTEFGQTLSRADGNFDMAVNGGGMLVVDYQKDGYLPVQRQVHPQWNDYAFAEDIVMISLDPQVTTVQLGNGEAMQVAQGSPQTDAEGTRQATLLFPQGTTATMTLPDGSTQALTTLNVRATEYTVGENGFEAMPGALPPTSAYTYAVELSVDEAMAAGSSRVDFNQPVPLYVDNFLNFPTGEIVPAGYYDHEDAIWKAGDNGRVIEILAIESGKAVLDTEGKGEIATDTELQALGIDEAELEKLASLYVAGKTLWRTPISHFTPWDCNWPYGPPLDAEPPSVPEPETNSSDEPENSDEENEKCGCVISPQRQTLGESLPVAGTPLDLVYRSDRTAGYKNNVADVTLSGGSVPASLNSIRLDIEIAGQRFTERFSGVANQQYQFEWDGLDGYGRDIGGEHTANITISYLYGCVYYAATSDFRSAWAQVGNTGNAIGTRSSGCRSVVLTQKHKMSLISPLKIETNTVGNWSLNRHHTLDVTAGVIRLGDGGRRALISAIIDTVVGNGGFGYSGDGGPAKAAELRRPHDIAVDAAGNLYIADSSNYIIRRVSPNGTIDTVAGIGNESVVLAEGGYSGDGGPATAAELDYPKGIAVDAAGNLYIADSHNHRIRRVSPNGTIDTVAGTGSEYLGEGGYSGDGGPATAAQLNVPSDIALDAAGNLYIADSQNNCIRRVSPDGTIDTVAGTCTEGNWYFEGGYSGDGGPATAAELYYPVGIAIDAAGNLYIADSHNHRIRRVSLDGTINTVAGNGEWRGEYGDGGPATEAYFSSPHDVAVDSTGNLYISDYLDDRIRRVSTDGTIDTVAGSETEGFVGDGGPATAARLDSPAGIAIDATGNLYIADSWNQRIRRVTSRSSLTPGSTTLVPSADGTELHHFDGTGRHVQTSDAATGAIRYNFEYDADGLLSTVTDGFGNRTSLERDNSGHATAIIAPDGQRTDLTVDTSGHLVGLRNPAGQQWFMNYTSDGLLTRFENPNDHANNFAYNAKGRLIQDEAPNGGGWTIVRTKLDDGYQTNMISGEGRVSRYGVERTPTGERVYINEAPDGSTTMRRHTYSSTAVKQSNGTEVTSTQGPDPRFGMFAPVTAEQRIETPTGLVLLQTTERSAELEDPSDLLSHTALATTVTVNDRTLTTAFDVASLTWTQTSPEGRIQTSRLNENGLLEELQITGLAEVNYQYDEQGKLKQIARGVNNQRAVEFDYDENGYLDSLTDAQNKTVTFENDIVGRVLQQTFPNGSTVAYDYDPNGNLTELRLPSGETHRFQYTSVDQQEVYSPPGPDASSTDAPIGSGHPTTQYQYNKDKQLEAITRPDGVVVDYVYNDTTGQLTDLITPTGTYEYDYYGEFDPIHSGQLKAVTAPGGQQTSYEYDGFLLIGTNWSGPISGTLGYEYNNYFEPISQTLNGDALSLSYNDDSQLTQAGDLAIEYVAENGILNSTSMANLDSSYSYNNFGELTDYSSDYLGTELYQYSLNRDEVGRITGKTESHGGSIADYQYLYDDNDRLEQVIRNGVTIQSWGYDANGNRTHENGVLVAQFDAQDRLIGYKDNEYRYTANGELTEKTDTDTNETTYYDYDAFSNLRSVTLPDGTNIEYVIDGQNRRVGKMVNGNMTQGFLYQGQLNPVAELDGNNSMVARFVYGDKINGPSYMIKDGANYRVVSDHLGSVRLVVNSQTGEVAQRLDYDAWGNITNDTNPGFQPFGYAGGIYDRDTGLTRFGARDYDPEIGRWTTKDPIGFSGGLNHYEYVGSRPLNYADPTGLRWETIEYDYHGIKNWSMAIANRISNLEEGTIMSPENCVGCTRDVIQVWIPHPDDPQNNRNICMAGDPQSGDIRKIGQVYGEFPDPWQVGGESWHWEPPVPTPTYQELFEGVYY